MEELKRRNYGIKMVVPVLFLLLTFATQQLYGRAGGGGGGGGGGGFGGGGYRGSFRRGYSRPWEKMDTIIVVSVLCTVSVLFYVLWNFPKWVRNYKNKKINKLLLSSSLIDPMWDKEQLTNYIKASYLKVQDAWMKQDMDLVKDLVDENIRISYQRLLNNQIRGNVYNYMSDIKFFEIKIIGMEDFLDNNKDTFSVFISGEMIDLIVRRNRQILQKHKAQYFADLYFFSRFEEQWKILSRRCCCSITN